MYVQNGHNVQISCDFLCRCHVGYNVDIMRCILCRCHDGHNVSFMWGMMCRCGGCGCCLCDFCRLGIGCNFTQHTGYLLQTDKHTVLHPVISPKVRVARFASTV